MKAAKITGFTPKPPKDSSYTGQSNPCLTSWQAPYPLFKGGLTARKATKTLAFFIFSKQKQITYAAS